jgi:hypothetical protein
MENKDTNGTTQKTTTLVERMVMPFKTICPKCGEKMKHSGTIETLVRYYSPKGHDHDDNCRKRTYFCENEHYITVSKRNTCSACDWKGKEKCFCHEGIKLNSWPVEA